MHNEENSFVSWKIRANLRVICIFFDQESAPQRRVFAIRPSSARISVISARIPPFCASSSAFQKPQMAAESMKKNPRNQFAMGQRNSSE